MEKEKSTFLISYDLPSNDKGYESLIESLKKLNAKHVLESVWSISLSDCYVTPLMHALKRIAKNAKLIVVEVKAQACTKPLERPYPVKIKKPARHHLFLLA